MVATPIAIAIAIAIVEDKEYQVERSCKDCSSTTITASKWLYVYKTGFRCFRKKGNCPLV